MDDDQIREFSEKMSERIASLEDRNDKLLETARRVEGEKRYAETEDRKSTRLNSSHGYISYAVFCLKKKKRHIRHRSLIHSRTRCALSYNSCTSDSVNVR